MTPPIGRPIPQAPLPHIFVSLLTVVSGLSISDFGLRILDLKIKRPKTHDLGIKELGNWYKIDRMHSIPKSLNFYPVKCEAYLCASGAFHQGAIPKLFWLSIQNPKFAIRNWLIPHSDFRILFVYVHKNIHLSQNDGLTNHCARSPAFVYLM